MLLHYSTLCFLYVLFTELNKQTSNDQETNNIDTENNDLNENSDLEEHNYIKTMKPEFSIKPETIAEIKDIFTTRNTEFDQRYHVYVNY